jgi:hypothetical protein
MNTIFNTLDVKKQLKELSEKTAEWHKLITSGEENPDDTGPIIKLHEIFIGEESLGYDNTGSIYKFLWIQYFEGVFDVYETTFVNADIYNTLDQEYTSTICSTQSRQKVLRKCREYYKKLEQA